MRGKRIDYPNDVDEFTLRDTVGAEFNAFLESSRPFMLLVVAPTNTTLGARVDHDADTALFHHGTGISAHGFRDAHDPDRDRCASVARCRYRRVPLYPLPDRSPNRHVIRGSRSHNGSSAEPDTYSRPGRFRTRRDLHRAHEWRGTNTHWPHPWCRSRGRSLRVRPGPRASRPLIMYPGRN